MKMECFLFICATYLIAFTMCGKTNNSASGLPKNTALIAVQGQINGIETQSWDDLTPNPITFNEGEQLVYTCWNNYMSLQTIRWIQQKRSTTVFTGGAVDNLSTINMTLYRFDDDSTLSCIIVNRESKITETGMTINLRVKHNSLPPVVTGSEDKVIKAGGYFEIPCKADEDVYAVSPDSSEIIIDQPPAFTVTHDHDGMTLFCIKESNGIRLLHNITLLTVKSDKPSSSLYIYITAAVVVVILVGVLILTYRKFTKRKRTENVCDQSEPLRATPQQVIYAHLHLAQARENLNQREEQNPYAQIIGVLTPRDEN